MMVTPPPPHANTRTITAGGEKPLRKRGIVDTTDRRSIYYANCKMSYISLSIKNHSISDAYKFTLFPLNAADISSLQQRGSSMIRLPTDFIDGKNIVELSE